MNIGIYAGSFNPFTIGHADVVEQAEALFDRVLIARLVNFQKTSNPDYDYLNRETAFYKNREVTNFSGLLIDFLSTTRKTWITSGYSDVKLTLIRGVRNGHDIEYELNMCKTNDALAGKIIPVVFFRCNPSIDYVSSRMVRELFKHNETEARKYIPR